MSNANLSQFLKDRCADDNEIVVVTSKQYLAVADDFLRRLFPDITPDLLPHPGAFTVFIKDDDYVLH